MTGRRPYHRAGFRGRSMATGRVPGHGRDPRPPTPDLIPGDLGELVQIISKDDLAQTEARPTSLRDVEAVASFNWLDGQGRPTIAIPGKIPSQSIFAHMLSQDY